MPDWAVFVFLLVKKGRREEGEGGLLFTEIVSGISYTLSLFDSCRYGSKGTFVPLSNGRVRSGSSASMRTTYGDILVAKDLLVSGPRGTYSQACPRRLASLPCLPRRD